MRQIRQWPAWFDLKTRDDKDIWCYIVAVSTRFEDLVAYFLWEHNGRPCQKVEQYLEWHNLRRLIGHLERATVEGAAVLSASVLRTLKEVDRLRNAIAHRHATYGAAESETPEGRPMGVYHHEPVFRDRQALRALVEDVTAATTALARATLASGKKTDAKGGV